jgi:hypothetical protein
VDKKAYRNKRLERLNTEYNLGLPGQASGEEGLSGDAASGVGRGYAMPGEPVMPAMITEQEEEEQFPRESRRTHSIEYDKLLDVLVSLSDEMDKNALFDFSNFSDFLIKKVAQQKDIDYQLLFKDLIVKVNDSDILGKNKIILLLTKEYNSLLKESIALGEPESDSHREAYQVVAGMVIDYV